MTARLPKFLVQPALLVLLAGTALVAWANLCAYRALPEDLTARLQALRIAGLPAEAEPVFEQLLQRDPLNPDLHVAFIQNHFEIPAVKSSSQAGAALLSYYQARLDDPAEAGLAHLAIGRVRAEAGDYRRALRQYRQVRDRDLKYLHLSIAQARATLGQYGPAEAAYRAEIAAGGDVAQAAGGLAALYRQQHLPAQAQALLMDPAAAPHVPYEIRRWIALQEKDFPAYLQLAFLAPWSWVSLTGGLLALFAGGVWLLYFRQAGLLRRIPPWVVLAAPLLGAALAPAVFVLRDALAAFVPLTQDHSRLEALSHALLYIGLVEELVKLAPVLLIILPAAGRREPFEGLALGSLSALGFATFENGLYFSQVGPGVAAARFLYSLPLHLAMTAIVVGALSPGGNHPRSMRRLPLLALAWAAGIHGLTDFLVLQAGGVFAVFGAALMLLLIYGYGQSVHAARQNGPAGPQAGAGSALFPNGGGFIFGTGVLGVFAFLSNHLTLSTRVANHQFMTAVFMSLPALWLLETLYGKTTRRERPKFTDRAPGQ